MTDEELREHIALLRRVRTDFRHVEANLLSFRFAP
jgi:hypothetical protein